MRLRIATFNLNNLFERAKILNLDKDGSFFSTTKEVLGDVSRLNSLLEEDSHAGSSGKDIEAILKKYFVDHPFKKKKYFIINEIKEKQYSVKNGSVELNAQGKEDWLGFVEFTKERTSDVAVVNTARVLDAVNADIICTMVATSDFNDTPGSDPLKPLLKVPHLKDVLDWNGFTGERGTYHTSKQQLDYLMVSKPLIDVITDVGVERRGILKRNNNSFVEVTSKVT